MIISHGQTQGMHGRSVILRHIERTGCTIAGQPVWTPAEMLILCELYPDCGAARMSLRRRTTGAIAKKARQLGLVPPRLLWSEKDAIRLRKPYVTGIPIASIVEMFPGRSRDQIWKKAHGMGYHRLRRPPKDTAMPLVDSIRRRAFELGLSMVDLDTFVGGKRYFVSPRHMNWRSLQKAMKILGGQPFIRWAQG